jgi:hypothetical protein
MSNFNPNRLSFEAGLNRIRAVVGDEYTKGAAIVTSRDDGMNTVTERLRTDNVPNGFSKWQLPVFLNGPSQFFMSYAAPDLEVPIHSHDLGDGLRVILSGSIEYNGRELGPGDWMFIPKGLPYEFKVGPKGAGMCYCYECCCA